MLKAGDGQNINGPSLIRAPAWLPAPLGRYYLYFADHNGQYIRLAYADSIPGPYKIYEPGTLRIDQATWCEHMVASPDVHVDEGRRQILMYFHCGERVSGNMVSFVATSVNGLEFVPRPAPLGPSFFRVFHWQGDYYALAMPGEIYRSHDGITGFAKGPTLFGSNMRHSAVVQTDDRNLWVFYTNVGEKPPEAILMTRVPLTEDWLRWEPEPSVVVLEPQRTWEGADLPLALSTRGPGTHRRELRDPALFEESGKWYLLYSVAGESGIAIAELTNWRP